MMTWMEALKLTAIVFGIPGIGAFVFWLIYKGILNDIEEERLLDAEIAESDAEINRLRRERIVAAIAEEQLRIEAAHEERVASVVRAMAQFDADREGGAK